MIYESFPILNVAWNRIDCVSPFATSGDRVHDLDKAGLTIDRVVSRMIWQHASLEISFPGTIPSTILIAAAEKNRKKNFIEK